MFTVSPWPTKTGTRTEVVETLMFGSRILCVSGGRKPWPPLPACPIRLAGGRWERRVAAAGEGAIADREGIPAGEGEL